MHLKRGSCFRNNSSQSREPLRFDYWTSFFQMKFDVKKDTIAIFIARIRKHVKRLMEAGHPLEDMYPAFQSIRTLRPDFQGTVHILYRWPDKDFKLDKIEMELIAEENRIRQLMMMNEVVYGDVKQQGL
ncbi:hypothetical protein CDAR_407751 [Caerostris darwini]|uniref:Uncharacterized protein n=1 Tax=Caerostris darwini TaxID=1538125 RepID=A0AAV4Q4R2_9ARAC|nr:hypothetical protein CDAR_407751 [Caerostris darwini]